MYEIIDFDKRLFLDLNKLHAEWLDPIMLFFSSYTAWGLVALLFLIYIYYVKDKTWRWSSICFLAVAVLSTNLLNNLVKIIIARPRPIHEEAFSGVIHAIEKFDPSYSFFSAHSSSSFALAVFASLLVRKTYFTAMALPWAFMVAYSRIYVGKHYPMDVLVGLLFGVLMAMIWWELYKRYTERKTIKNKQRYGKEKNY